MLQVINDLPKDVVGFRATGTVTSDDYEKILIPEVDKLADRQDKLNYLFVLDTDLSNVQPGAWLDDVKVSLKHFSKWNKIAIVTDKPGLNKVVETVDTLMHGETRTFTSSQLDEAKAWLAA